LSSGGSIAGYGHKGVLSGKIAQDNSIGRVAERFKALVLKTSDGVTRP
jgi:hypothetical protein